MVEAAGIEPASESTPPGSPTCLSRDLSSSGRANTSTLPAGPSLTESRLAPSGLHARPACFYDKPDRRRRRGFGGPSLAVFKRRSRAQRCRWLLLRCPFFNEVRASPACAPGFVALVETGSPPIGEPRAEDNLARGKVKDSRARIGHRRGDGSCAHRGPPCGELGSRTAGLGSRRAPKSAPDPSPRRWPVGVAPPCVPRRGSSVEAACLPKARPTRRPAACLLVPRRLASHGEDLLWANRRSSFASSKRGGGAKQASGGRMRCARFWVPCGFQLPPFETPVRRRAGPGARAMHAAADGRSGATCRVAPGPSRAGLPARRSSRACRRPSCLCRRRARP